MECVARPSVSAVGACAGGRSALLSVLFFLCCGSSVSPVSSPPREASASTLYRPLSPAAASKKGLLGVAHRRSPSRHRPTLSSREKQNTDQVSAVQATRGAERVSAEAKLPASSSHTGSDTCTENAHRECHLAGSPSDRAGADTRVGLREFCKQDSPCEAEARPPVGGGFRGGPSTAVNRSSEPIGGEVPAVKKANSPVRLFGRKIKRHSSWSLGVLSHAVSSVPAFKRKLREVRRSPKAESETRHVGYGGRRKIRFFSLIAPTRRLAQYRHADAHKAEGTQEEGDSEGGGGCSPQRCSEFARTGTDRKEPRACDSKGGRTL